MNEATTQVQEKLKLHTFSFDSESEGRVVIVSAQVQYAEIENGDASGCSPDASANF